MKKIVKTNRAIPKKVLNVWGPNFPETFGLISQRLAALGFIGPLTWSETHSIPFCLDVSDTIRVILSLSSCGGIGNAKLFDGVAVIQSKTIHDRTLASDPWYPIGYGYEKWHEGYVACLTYRLAHLKWAERESTINPAWAMTLDTLEYEGVAVPNAMAWLADFEALLLPILLKLKTDADLTQAMLAAINYVRPSWVKSDGPSFGRIRELVVALNRAGPASNGA